MVARVAFFAVFVGLLACLKWVDTRATDAEEAARAVLEVEEVTWEVDAAKEVLEREVLFDRMPCVVEYAAGLTRGVCGGWLGNEKGVAI